MYVCMYVKPSALILLYRSRSFAPTSYMNPHWDGLYCTLVEILNFKYLLSHRSSTHFMACVFTFA